MAARTQRLGLPGVAVLTVSLGGWLVYAGIRDVPVVDGLRELLGGKQPTARAGAGSDVPWRELQSLGGSALAAAASTAAAAGNWDYRLHPELARRLRAFTAASGGRVATPAGGGWRSHQRQIELRTKNGCPDVWRSPAEDCTTPTAIPGTSKHERTPAEAFDLTYSRDGQGWAKLNAARFGLRFPIRREPWHVEALLPLVVPIPLPGR